MVSDTDQYIAPTRGDFYDAGFRAGMRAGIMLCIGVAVGLLGAITTIVLFLAAHIRIGW